jgi:hypothetical protein
MKRFWFLIILILFAGCTGESKNAVQTTSPPDEGIVLPIPLPKHEPLKFVNTTQKLLGAEDFTEVLEHKKTESSQNPTANYSVIELGSDSMNVTNRVAVYPSPAHTIFGGYGYATSEGVLKDLFGENYTRVKHDAMGEESSIYKAQKDSDFVYLIVLRTHILVSEITIFSAEELGTERLLEIGEKSSSKLVL